MVATGSYWQPMPTNPLLVILYTGYRRQLYYQINSFTGIFRHFKLSPCSPHVLTWAPPPSNFEEPPCSQHLWETVGVRVKLLGIEIIVVLQKYCKPLTASISDILTGLSLLLWNQSEQNLCPTFSSIIICVSLYRIISTVKPHEGSVKNGHFGQVAIFMKWLAFPSMNLIWLIGF